MFSSAFNKYDQTVWQQFSLENDGKFIVGQFDKLDAVAIIYRSHNVIFDRYILYQVVGERSFDTEFTRIRLECKTPNDLRFRLTTQSIVDAISKLFAAQDVQIGDRDFDRRFLVKGNDEFTIQRIFSDHNLRRLMLEQSDVVLHLLDSEGVFNEPIGKGNAMLYFISEAVVRKKEQLDSLLKMFKTLVDQLTKTNSIKPLKN